MVQSEDRADAADKGLERQGGAAEIKPFQPAADDRLSQA